MIEKIKALMGWYAMFATVLDVTEWNDAEKIAKLKILRAEIDREIGA